MLFVFDFDGVLADSSALCLDLLRQVQAERAGPPVPDDFWDRLDDISFGAMARYLGVTEEEQAAYVAQVFAHMARDAYRPALFDGIDAVLRSLARSGPIAVLSASPEVVIAGALERAEVADTVQAIRDGSDPASKAAKLPGLLNQFGAQASSAVMVGDAISDVRAGQANRMRTAAVAWGWQGRAKLEEACPDRLFDRVDALLELPDMLSAG